MRLLTRKNRIWLLLVGLAIFSWVVNSTYRSLSQKNAERVAGSSARLERGAELPANFELETVKGEKSSIGELRGKVLLINFWAGWCAPCLHEMPALYELQRDLGSRGFVVLGMNMDEDPQAGLRVLSQRVPGEAPFKMYRGGDSALADRFTFQALPFTVLVDREMKIRLTKEGEVDWRSAAAKRMIEGLL